MSDLKSYSDFLNKARHFSIHGIAQEQWADQIQQGRYYKFYREAKPGIYVLDFTQQRYLYCNDVMASFADQPVPDLMNAGLDLALKLWHPDDLKVYDRYILPVNLSFLKDKTVGDYGNYLFTCNYRVRQRKGHYRRVEQTSFFSKSLDDGMPLMTIGFLRDVTHRMPDNRIIHTIEDISGHEGKLKFNKTYNPDSGNSGLTYRELEILDLIVQGKSSLEIAKLLGIDKLTVDNHRKNMLKKTNAKNMVQLAVWATSMGYSTIKANPNSPGLLGM